MKFCKKKKRTQFLISTRVKDIKYKTGKALSNLLYRLDVMLCVFIRHIFILWELLGIGHFLLGLGRNLRYFLQPVFLSTPLDVPKTRLYVANLTALMRIFWIVFFYGTNNSPRLPLYTISWWPSFAWSDKNLFPIKIRLKGKINKRKTDKTNLF